MVSVVTRKREKHIDNAELINKLDKQYGMLECYPQTDHPTLLEFWSTSDPRKHSSFVVLMHIYQKECKVTLHGVNDYFIEIDDAKNR